jgi:hypothetical protein
LSPARRTGRLSAALARASEGRFIPLGSLGENASPDEYWADQYDYFDGHLRELYFPYPKQSFVKILSRREGRLTAISRVRLSKSSKQRRDLSENELRLKQKPWGKAGLIATGSLVLGYGPSLSPEPLQVLSQAWLTVTEFS